MRPSAVAPVTIDFESEPIDSRPNYPPAPVGLAIKYLGKPGKYFAFDHPEDNNSTPEDALAALEAAWSHPGGVLCHNGKFDYDVAQTHFGMPDLPWQSLHDTMFEVFLNNPDAKSHALKPSAEALLGMPPEERDAVKEWLVDHGYCTNKSKDWGAFICKAPGGLVGEYAIGDVVRTEKLHKLLSKELKKRKMAEALDTERELMPILLDMERNGVPVDLPRLERDCKAYAADLDALTKWILKRIKAKDRLRVRGKFKGQHTSINLDSGDDLVHALVEAGLVDTELLGKTSKGSWRTSKEALDVSIKDRVLCAALNHRASLQTCLGTFMQPWLYVAQQSGGRIFTTWNQLKQYGKGAAIGAVTGRLSSSPNFQNIPKMFKALWAHQKKGLPKCPLELLPLPLVRSYIAAPPGYVLLCRDYSQQEIRILAHYEDGDLNATYTANPWMDAHQTVMEEINNRLGSSFERGVIKQINFGLIYGMGVDLMAMKAECEPEEAKKAKAAVLSIYPGLKELQKDLKELAKNGEPLRTWGGRQYYCEEPKIVVDEETNQPRTWTFEYKMLNRLVQGSAADQTKRAVINYYKTKPARHQLLLTVHDELLALVPEEEEEMGMEVLRKAMEFNPFELPMLSEGKISRTNWSELKVFDKKGLRISEGETL